MNKIIRKYMNIFIVVIIVILFIIFFPKALNDLRLNYNFKIPFIFGDITGKQLAITPSKKHISFFKDGDNWNEEFYVNLINNTNKTYYNVNIAFDYPGYAFVTAMPEEQSTFVKLGTEKNNTSLGADIGFLYGEDEDGVAGGQTKINNISPGEVKKIKIKVVKKQEGVDFDLNFKIFNYSENPDVILSK